MGLLFDTLEELVSKFSKKDFSCRTDLIKRMDNSGMAIQKKIEAINEELAKAKELLNSKEYSVYEKNVLEVVESVYDLTKPFMDKRGLKDKLSYAPGHNHYDTFYGLSDEEANYAKRKAMLSRIP